MKVGVGIWTFGVKLNSDIKKLIKEIVIVNIMTYVKHLNFYW